MAFNSRQITKIANLLGLVTSTDPTPGLWYYSSGADSLATVLGAGYFNSFTSFVEGGIIHVIAPDGMHTLSVVSNIAGVVTVADVSNADKIAKGAGVTATAADTVATGLPGPLNGVVIAFNDDIGVTEAWITAYIGAQAGAPPSGSFIAKSWEPTSSANPTPIPATTFGKHYSWFAF